MTSVSFWAAVPHYVSLAPNPRAALALCERVSSLLEVPIDVSELEEMVEGYTSHVTEAVSSDEDAAAYVDELEQRGVTVNYAIHPVAGRMPGHMNVLLAEADVPYEQLKEMEEINPEMPRTDVAVIVGANDVTNPAAKNDPDSPIAGMPIIEVDQAQQVIVIKRSLSPGFAGIDNDLFYEPNTSMLFADAKQAAADIAAEIGNL